jgi:hypothetical protein
MDDHRPRRGVLARHALNTNQQKDMMNKMNVPKFCRELNGRFTIFRRFQNIDSFKRSKGMKIPGLCAKA